MLLELSGFLKKDMAVEPFSIEISRGEFSEIDESYFCVVSAPFFLTSKKKIFGIDKSQAEQLSMAFVKNLMRGYEVLDTGKKPIFLGF